MLMVVPGTSIQRNWPLIRNSGSIAPNIDNGTLTRITSGSRRLSNCAASTRKMTISAKKKVSTSWLPSRTYCRASAESEAVDVVLAGQERQRIADRLHRDAEVVGLVAVDIDRDGRLVEGEVAVGDHEQSAFARSVLDLLHRLKDRHEIAGRID